MYAPVNGEYIIFHGNFNELYFRNGWAYFCQINDIVVGSMLAVRVETREECIGLFMAKLH
jgi:hypothetical protein